MSTPDPHRWRALALLCVANFMVILDAQIVLLAVPSIEADLHMTPLQSPWVMSAYLLAFGGLLLLGGRAGDLLGRRRMFLVGSALFLVASLMCGLSWNGPMLIGMRVLQGISAALMAPTALSILLTTFTGTERNRAIAFWSSVGGFGATTALLLGGVITGGLGWSWIFFLNVPVAVVMLVLAPRLLQESSRDAERRSFDLTGAITVTGGLALLVFAIVEAPVYGWASLPTLSLVALAVILLAVFVWTERRSSEPLVPLAVFRNRPLVLGNAVMVVMAGLANGMSLLVSLYAQQVMGFSPLRFGVATVVMPVVAVTGAMITQQLIPKVGVRASGSVGMVVLGVALLLFSRLDPSDGYVTGLLPALVVFGIGLGICSVTAPVAALGNVGEREFGLASGINNAAFQIGAALGVALVSTVALGSLDPSGGPLGMTATLSAGFLALAAAAIVGLVLAFALGRAPSASGSDTAVTGADGVPETSPTTSRADPRFRRVRASTRSER